MNKGQKLYDVSLHEILWYEQNIRATTWHKRCTISQSAFTSSKLTLETLEQGVKYVQS